MHRHVTEHRLSKHHGLGNDFLVLEIGSTDDVSAPEWADRARAWCDRRTGVGADGLLLLERKQGDRLGMTLYNADGSRAEMSGNGIRCLVQAAHGDGPTGVEYVVDTDAGERRVSVVGRIDADTHLHVSFDLDCLDPTDAPGVGTGVRGGPTYREMQLCMEMIADTGRLASLDLVEINPARDVCNRTAELAVDLVRSLLGASTLMR